MGSQMPLTRIPRIYDHNTCFHANILGFFLNLMFVNKLLDSKLNSECKVFLVQFENAFYFHSLLLKNF